MSKMSDLFGSMGYDTELKKVEDLATEELMRERFTFLTPERELQIADELNKRGEIKDEY